jgi:hypothetical protein
MIVRFDMPVDAKRADMKGGILGILLACAPLASYGASSHALRVKAVPAFGGIVSASPSDISITFGSGRAALLRNIVIEQALAALVLGAAAFLGTLPPSRGGINERGQGDATPTRSAKEMLGVARADPIDPCCVEPGEFDRGDGR